jgi:uncharacterized protein YcbK (DUF882 family)
VEATAVQLNQWLKKAGLALTLISLPAFASAAPASKKSSTAHASVKSKKKKKRSSHPVFSGHQVPASQFRTDPLPQATGRLKLYSVNYRESLEVNLYNPDGTMNEDSLTELYHFWRCRRTGTEKPIHPELFAILSLIQDHFDGRTIELVSGFRNQKHTTSYHFHGTASDIRIPGVSDKQLHAFVQTLDTGHMGLGIYPRAGFIHVDVRPEQSFRWTDYSPPGGGEGGGHRKKHASKKRNS